MRVLLAVDGSECSERAAHVVTTQFPPERAEVRVLHVDEWPKDLPASLAFAEGPAAARDVLALHEARRREADGLVARIAHQLTDAGFSVETAVHAGDARHVILEYALEWRADLIVLGSHGRTGVNRFLLGSVSDSVARHASCSVQIVRGGPPAA